MKKFIESSMGLFLVIGAILGFLLPQIFLSIKDWAAELLMLTLFFGFLKIQFSEIFHLKKNFYKLVIFSVFTLLILPTIFWFIPLKMSSDVKLGFLLLTGVSGAVATPLLANTFKLKILWSTAFVVLTSFFMPFTLPFLIKILSGNDVQFDILEMCLFLSKMIFVPAFVAIFISYLLPNLKQKLVKHSGVISVFFLPIFLAVVIASNQVFFAENIKNTNNIVIVIGLIILFFIRFLVGYLIPVQDETEKWTNSLMFGNMNNGLMILLAAEFFSETVLLVTLFSEIPWVLAQFIFPICLKKYKNKS